MIEYLGDFRLLNILIVSLVIWPFKARLPPRASEASACKGRGHRGQALIVSAKLTDCAHMRVMGALCAHISA